MFEKILSNYKITHLLRSLKNIMTVEDKETIACHLAAELFKLQRVK